MSDKHCPLPKTASPRNLLIVLLGIMIVAVGALFALREVMPAPEKRELSLPSAQRTLVETPISAPGDFATIGQGFSPEETRRLRDALYLAFLAIESESRLAERLQTTSFVPMQEEKFSVVAMYRPATGNIEVNRKLIRYHFALAATLVHEIARSLEEEPTTEREYLNTEVASDAAALKALEGMRTLLFDPSIFPGYARARWESILADLEVRFRLSLELHSLKLCCIEMSKQLEDDDLRRLADLAGRSVLAEDLLPPHYYRELLHALQSSPERTDIEHLLHRAKQHAARFEGLQRDVSSPDTARD